MFCTIAFGQTDSGSIRVRVEDTSLAPIESASVRVQNAQTGAFLDRETNAAGYATFSPLVRGAYQVSVSKPGFQTKTISDVQLLVDQRLLLRIDLAVAAVSETVEVTASVATIQTEQASLGQTIGSKAAVELPLNGRRYTELALLSPGVAASTLNPTTRGPGWFVANGNYHTQNNFLLDGVDNNQGTTNAQALSAQVVQPNPDAIAEFKVQTNAYSAEFGRSAGAVVNVSLKSGGNDVHGTGWYFNRDSALAANRWQSNLIGAPRDQLQWHQYGGTLGGPIVKNKLFYFGSFEGFNRRFSDSGVTAVPTSGQRNGVFAFDVRDPQTGQPFPNRTIPSDRFDVLGKKLMDLYPQPNLPGRVVTGGRVVENYGVQLPATEDTYKYDIRGDYLADDRNQIMARLSYLRQDIFRTPIFPGLADGVGNQGTQFNKNYSGATAWTRILSESMINVFRFGMNYTFAEFAHATVNDQKADEFGFRGFPPEMLQVGGLPLIETANYNPLGTRNFRPQFQAPYTVQFTDTFSVVRGRQIGSNWNGFTNALLGGWQFSTIVSARSGLPVNVGLAQTGINPQTGQNYRFFSRNGGSLRPDRVGEPNTGISPKEDRFRFLDVNAYRVQTVNTAGNAARNSAWGPHFWQFDTSLVKRFNFTERVFADFRWEAFNLFNTVNFQNPNGTFGGTSFGQINNAFDPRVMQLALRVGF